MLPKSNSKLESLQLYLSQNYGIMDYALVYAKLAMDKFLIAFAKSFDRIAWFNKVRLAFKSDITFGGCYRRGFWTDRRNFYLLVSIRLVIVYDLELEAINVHFARMAELVDAVDSKSTARKGVRVRLSLRAP